jgi:hypothetical protein
MPHGSNRRALTFQDRYIVLVAGYKYPRTRNPDGTVSEVYTPEEKTREWEAFFEKTVLAYETRRGAASPAGGSWRPRRRPGTSARGGEGGSRLWHPATFQVGRIGN